MLVKVKRFNVVVAIVISIGLDAQAATIKVPADQPTIQQGISAAVNGDTVLVAPGLYKEHLDFLGKEIAVLSSAGRDSTIVEGVVEKVPIVKFWAGETNNSVLDGFTIRRARDVEGISCGLTSPIIRNCDIYDCLEIGRGGRGIFIKGGAPKILYNRIHDNAADYRGGGGVSFKGNEVGVVGTGAEIAFNDIYNNWGGGICESYNGLYGNTTSHQAYIHHNLIRSNFGPGVVLRALSSGGSTRRVVSNVIVDNSLGIERLESLGGTADSVFNNIVVSNHGAGMNVLPGVYFDYNDVWDNDSLNDPGANGISQDPLFIAPLSGDFSLDGGSPCIDAGIPDAAYNDLDESRGDIGMGAFSGPVCDPYWECPPVLTGDVNNSNTITSADIIYLVGFCFKSGPAPYWCPSLGDCDCNGAVNAGDIIFLVNYLFGENQPKALFKGGGDPPCNSCRVVQDGTWSCP
jgi:hypothetical protein